MCFCTKRLALCCVLCIIITGSCYASVPEAVKKRFQLVVKLIKEDNAAELSKYVQYPLGRDYPLPDVENAADFVKYYPTLFDAAFKIQLKLYNDTVIFEHHDAYGLVGGHFDGEIWMNEDGFITTVNYSSATEKALQKQLVAK